MGICGVAPYDGEGQRLKGVLHMWAFALAKADGSLIAFGFQHGLPKQNLASPGKGKPKGKNNRLHRQPLLLLSWEVRRPNASKMHRGLSDPQLGRAGGRVGSPSGLTL